VCSGRSCAKGQDTTISTWDTGDYGDSEIPKEYGDFDFEITLFKIGMCIFSHVVLMEGRFVRFQQSLYMDLLVSREDYDGRVRRYRQFRKLLKHTSFIYLKTRTTSCMVHH
jgi:hypothetical protein